MHGRPERVQVVLEMALEAGFDLAGIAPLRPPQAAARFETWLEAGRHADMAWLERNRERILDPRLVLPQGKSILVLGAGHPRAAVTLAGGGRVARYAAGRDYHNVLGRRLKKLVRQLREAGLVEHARSIVDAGPLLERSHAAEAGLGFESKAANLLHPRFGPWFFLAEVLIDADLEPTPSPPAGSCGTCTACLDACPTAAILEPGVVDAQRCISYQTIENRGAIPRELRGKLAGWTFGCDVCSEVCPWGQSSAGGAPDTAAAYGTHPAVAEGTLVDWLRRAPERFSEELRGSPLQRPKRAGLARNAALALAETPTEEGRTALLQALAADPSALVREAAGWSLAHAHREDRGVTAALAAAHEREPEAAAAHGLARSLDEA